MKVNLLNGENLPYKPMLYPEAYSRYELHDAAKWSKNEISLSSDVQDWQSLPDDERELLKYLFLLFTQNDVSVGKGYDVLLRCFKPTEICMLLRNQADRENTHIDAYSYLLDTLGFPESIYADFKEIDVMDKKLEFIENARVKKYEEYEAILKDSGYQGNIADKIDLMFKSDLAYMLAVYAGCTEGVSLFAQFAILLSYTLKGRFKGMGQIVTWSIRDEEMHCQNNSWLFKQLVKENREIWNDTFKKKLYSAFREIVEKEKAYLDYIYSKGSTPVVAKEDMYKYLEYIADRRLLGLGLKANYDIKSNPLPYMDTLLDSPEYANFFTNKVTTYSRDNTLGEWGDVTF